VVEIGKRDAVVEDASGTRRLNGFDTIILAIGGETRNDSIYNALEGKVAERYIVGDAAKPREILDAVSEGQEVAIKI
jgi:2,4-dienoyl-CoA reductase (NADPH2)